MNEVSAPPQTLTPVGDRRAVPLDHPVGRSPRLPNISGTERLVSVFGGAGLALAGLSRGRLSGLLTGALGAALAYRGWTGHCHVYELLGIDTSEHPGLTSVAAQQGVKVEKTIAIHRSPEELYGFWRDVENLPRVMRHLERVDAIDGKRSRWVAKGPLGVSVEWEAEVYNEREPELIAWRSLPGGEIDTAGSVHFKPLGHDRGTAVSVSMKYNPPAGKLGAAVASLLGSGLEHELDEDLRAFKSVMEAGEAPTTEGQPRG